MRFRSFVFLAGAVGSSLVARADAVYTFTGGYYQHFYQDPSYYPFDQHNYYTTSERVNGFVSFAQPLAPNLSDITVQPLDYSFNDGFVLHGPPGPKGIQHFLEFSTDARGDITTYSIQIVDDNFISGLNLYADATRSAQEASYYPSTAYSMGGGFASLSPVGETPEPSSFALLGTGLLGMAGLRKRRVG